jgi:tetratricopeptide (TPR) repeat protein
MKAVSFLSVLVLMASGAAAQEPAPGVAMTANRDATATPPGYERVLAEAIAEFNAGHFPEARSLFLQAHALSPNARTYRALGLVEYELRNYARSIEALSHALTDERRALDELAKPQLGATMAAASRFVGRFHVAPNAKVTVDGLPPIRAQDGAVLIEAGKHVLAIDGKEQAIDVRGGESVDLRPSTVPAIAVAAQASAEEAPPAEGAPARVVMEPEPVQSAPAKSTASSAPSIPQIALMGGGGVLFVSGLVVGALALDAHSDFEEQCPEGQAVCSSSARDKEESVKTLSVVSDVLWISGVAAAGAGLAWWLFDGASSEESTQASVWSTGHATGVDVRGRF